MLEVIYKRIKGLKFHIIVGLFVGFLNVDLNVKV